MMHPLIFYKNFRKRQKLHQSFHLSPQDLVLDIGSGHNPNPRANVLCDRFLEDQTERNEQPLTIDRPLVLGDASSLPFKDKAFDFVICSHLLEHVSEPEVVLKELERVGKRGYIETPSAIWEKIHSFPFHRWYVRLKEEKIIFSPKEKVIHDQELKHWVSTNPEISRFVDGRFEDLELLVRYHWNSKIDFQIENGVKQASVDFVHSQEPETAEPLSLDNHQVSLGLKVIRYWGKSIRGSSDSKIQSFEQLIKLCFCPKCKRNISMKDEKSLACNQCGKKYEIQNINGRLIPQLIV